MKNLKIIVLVLLCIALLAACSDNGGTGTGTDDNPAAGGNADGSSDSEEEKDPDAPDLPQVDMGGRDFMFLTAGWGEDSDLSKDVAVEEYTGDPIYDAGYERRLKIEQRYNINLKSVLVAGADEAVNRYRTAISAGDGSYDAAITTCTNFSTLLIGGYLIDFKDIPHIDMNKAYWNKNFYDAMSISGTNYAADGSISKRSLECVWIMAFNKSIIADYNFESPFELVKSGRWTYDRMHEMARQVARDLNGDGMMTREDDMWGINYTGDTIVGIINGVGVRLAVKDSDGIPRMTVDEEINLTRLMRIFTDMRDNSYSIDTLFVSGGGVSGMGDVDIFSQNRCLFLACASHNVSISAEQSAAAANTQGLRDLDIDFGIIPYPKWDDAQPNYLPHTAGNYHPVLTIPQTNGELENTGIILEALAYEGHRTIIPEFYESLLKTKTVRDEESAEMIDYIFGNISYDIGTMYNFGGILGTFGYTMSTELRREIVSTVERTVVQWQRAIDVIIAELENGY